MKKGKKKKKRQITAVDISEVIGAPKKPILIDGYPEATHLRRTKDNDEARAQGNSWPVSAETALKNTNDARFNALSEALK